MHITLIAGARPNFMKIAPIVHALQKKQAQGANVQFSLVHTGQHFDKNMSADFFEQLGIPEPNVNLESGGGTQAEQTANIMVRFEAYLQTIKTNLVLVVGDVTSTLACSIVAKKLCIDVAHVEAGIRSGDRTMPEEINRMVTDSITDYFFTTTKHAGKNLENAGVASSQIFFVGNTMIDTLLKQMPQFKQPAFFNEQGLQKGNYIVLTLHRPSNVDDEQKLSTLLQTIAEQLGETKVVFPVHPRTAKKLEQIKTTFNSLVQVQPLPYLEFNYLVQNSKAVVTDSGGITEETTVMGIPCITLRTSTERPETVEIGTNELIGVEPENIVKWLQKLQSGLWKKGAIPELWDGKTAERIVNQLEEIYNK
jgi:UDP-N-acetylglucosamine 2-epimerase (non-hydrolysing)